jgi:hypothetical protein
LLVVLWLIGVLFIFTMAATMLMRPGRISLDLHHEFAGAHAAADGALVKALANLNTGKAGDVAEVTQQAVVRGVAPNDTANTLEILATGKVRSQTPVENAPAREAWSLVRVRVLAVKDSTGVWRVAEYRVVESVRQTK